MSDPSQADEQAKFWCEQAAQGDRQAACELIQNFHGVIFAYLRRLAGNDEDAGDLTQETFRKTWQSISKFRGASSVRSWIHRIAYCTYVDWVRQQRPSACQPEEWWAALPCGEPSPAEAAARHDAALRLYRLVEAIEPESRRAAIHLHYYQGLSLAESAEVLGLPVSTLKYQLRSALDELKGAFVQRARSSRSHF